MDQVDSNTTESYRTMIKVLKERCKGLQNRVTTLEDENKQLKVNGANSRVTNLPEDLKNKEIIRLTEEISYNKVTLDMVVCENNRLWTLLKKLSKGNVNLSRKLEKIKQSLSEHDKSHSPLIRSKTFTQEGPQTNKNLPTVLAEQISMEYEDISLKLQDSISKLELEWQSEEILHNPNIEYNSNEEIDDFFTGEDIEEHLLILDAIKAHTAMQNDKMKNFSEQLREVYEKPCKMCEELKTKYEELLKVQSESNLCGYGNNNKLDRSICPICADEFNSDDFDVFHQHVESHFSQS